VEITGVTYTKSHAIIAGMFKNIFVNTFSRTEKSILSIFLALFIIPELLWSPVMNFFYQFYSSYHSGKGNLLFHGESLLYNGYGTLLRAVVLAQLLGLFFSFLFSS
jgi:hypothetical protein